MKKFVKTKEEIVLQTLRRIMGELLEAERELDGSKAQSNLARTSVAAARKNLELSCERLGNAQLGCDPYRLARKRTTRRKK